MKLLSLVGTRPQFIKVAAIERAAKDHCEHMIMSLDQHWDFEMSKMFSEEYDTQIRGFDPYPLAKYNPDYILVYGDCNCTVEASGIAKKYNYPLVHVEAGLRCSDPIPEEFIRRGVDHMSDVNLCPTKQSYYNLLDERCLGDAVFVGDVLLDLLEIPPLTEGDRLYQAYNLLTVHRQDSMPVLSEMLETIPRDLPVLWIMHPRVRDNFDSSLIPKDFIVNDPVQHSEMLKLICDANHVYTDSGGVYRESIWLDTPVTSLRPFHEFDGVTKEDFGNGDAAIKSIEYLEYR